MFSIKNKPFLKNVDIMKENMMVQIAYRKKKTNRTMGSDWLMTAPFPVFTHKSTVKIMTEMSMKVRYLTNHANQCKPDVRPIIFIYSLNKRQQPFKGYHPFHPLYFPHPEFNVTVCMYVIQ